MSHYNGRCGARISVTRGFNSRHLHQFVIKPRAFLQTRARLLRVTAGVEPRGRALLESRDARFSSLRFEIQDITLIYIRQIHVGT